MTTNTHHETCECCGKSVRSTQSLSWNDDIGGAVCTKCDTHETPCTGHTNTAAKSWTSHADCDHPRTPKARAACRKARKA